MSEDFVYFGAISLLKILVLKVIIYIPFRLLRSFILECFLDFSGISGESPTDTISERGSWCLRDSTTSDFGYKEFLTTGKKYGRPAADHVSPDSGVANTIAKYLQGHRAYTSLLDVGAGIGQYGFWFRNNSPFIHWRGYDGAENVESFTSKMVKWIDVTDPLFDTIDGQSD